MFAGQSDVLDIGCGRGEFLELLRERTASARAASTSITRWSRRRARGASTSTKATRSRYLPRCRTRRSAACSRRRSSSISRPTISAALLETAAHKIRPGGLIVLETINPACWLAFFESYIRDLTHVRPLHPETLQYMLRASGFHDVRDRVHVAGRRGGEAAAWRGPGPRRSPPVIVDLVETFNENVAKLNARLFTSRTTPPSGESEARSRHGGRSHRNDSIADNRKAGLRLSPPRDVRGGVALLGTEVKAIREGRVNLRESYCRLERAEAYLLGAHIGQYSHGGYAAHDPTRPRKLLLKRDELNKLLGKTTETRPDDRAAAHVLQEGPRQGRRSRWPRARRASTSARRSGAARRSARRARPSRPGGYNCADETLGLDRAE